MPFDEYNEKNDTGVNKHHIKYAIDKGKHNLQFHDLDDSTVKLYRYGFVGDSH